MSKSAIKTLVAVVSLLIGTGLIVGYVVSHGRPSVQLSPDQVYYLDLKTGKLFPGSAQQLAPIDAPSGAGNGVSAFVYACEACDAASMQIGYVEKYSDSGKETYARVRELGPDAPADLTAMVDRERFVALPPEAGQEAQWASMATPQGQMIAEQFRTACGEKKLPRRCNPSQ